jgi:hypothetical protein
MECPAGAADEFQHVAGISELQRVGDRIAAVSAVAAAPLVFELDLDLDPLVVSDVSNGERFAIDMQAKHIADDQVAGFLWTH